MIYQSGKRTKIIVATTAVEFEEKLNKELSELDRKKAKYELQFNHSLGFCAYIVSEYKVQVPESAEDEFELIGVRYTCLNCPKWVHPTKGNVKYTKCETVGSIRGAKTPCCEQFYEWLKNGEIEPEEDEKDA